VTSDPTMRLPDTFPCPPDTTSEAYRHWCEVRTVVRNTYPDHTARDDYIASVARQRGADAGEQLQKDVATLWDAARQQERALPGKPGIASALQDFLGI